MIIQPGARLRTVKMLKVSKSEMFALKNGNTLINFPDSLCSHLLLGDSSSHATLSSPRLVGREFGRKSFTMPLTIYGSCFSFICSMAVISHLGFIFFLKNYA